MDIPQPFDLQCFNKLLLILDNLIIDQISCPFDVFLYNCHSIVHGGRVVDYPSLIKKCQRAGFLKVVKNQISLTSKGREFLSLNKTKVFELNSNQKEYLIINIFFDGPWKSSTRSLLITFLPNYDEITFDLGLTAIPSSFNAIVFVLKYLGVIEEKYGFIKVTPSYVKCAVRIRGEGKGVTPSQLAEALQANEKMGFLAEEAIVRYEKKRLKSLGRVPEADLVRRISQLDVSAGYDIQSFNGDKPKLEFDRFIEVKASQKSLFSFYLTSNELRVAEQKGDCYWIYFVGGFSTKNQENIEPIMIQNPHKRLYEISQISIGINVLKITSIDSLPLIEINENGIKGLLL